MYLNPFYLPKRTCIATLKKIPPRQKMAMKQSSKLEFPLFLIKAVQGLVQNQCQLLDQLSWPRVSS